MNQSSLIGFLILAVVIATFSVQNSGEAVVILISTAFGAIMTIFLSLPGTFRLRMRLREQAQRIAELEQRLQERETRRTKDVSEFRQSEK